MQNRRHLLLDVLKYLIIGISTMISLGQQVWAAPPQAVSQTTDARHDSNPEVREGDVRDRAKYWQQRRGGISGSDLNKAIDRARSLPAASALPTIQGGMPPVIPGQGPTMGTSSQAAIIGSSPWVSFGPSPIGDFSNTFSGRVSTIAVDPVVPSTVYAGAATGGVWKSTDSGNSWTPMSNEANQPTLSIGSIAIDPTNHNVIYVGTGEHVAGGFGEVGRGVLKSTDAGASWTLLAQSPCATVPTERILVSSTGGVWLACSLGLFRSSDGGTTWTRMKATVGFPGGVAVTDVAISSDGSLLYAALPGTGLYRSQDGGSTWAQVPSISLPFRTRVAIAPSNSKIAYVLIDPIVNSTFFTTDGGNTWQLSGTDNVASSTQGGYSLEIAVDPLDPNRVFVAGLNVALNTGGTTGGSWSFVDTLHADQHAFAFPPCSATPCAVYVGNDGGIFFLPGGTGQATSVNGNLDTAQFTGGDLGLDFVSDPRAIGGTQDNGTLLFVQNAPPFPSNPFEWAHTFGGDGDIAYLDQIPGKIHPAPPSPLTLVPRSVHPSILTAQPFPLVRTPSPPVFHLDSMSLTRLV